MSPCQAITPQASANVVERGGDDAPAQAATGGHGRPPARPARRGQRAAGRTSTCSAAPAESGLGRNLWPWTSVIFDLDGVLIDSRAAITGCLNRALAENGLPERPPERSTGSSARRSPARSPSWWASPPTRPRARLHRRATAPAMPRPRWPTPTVVRPASRRRSRRWAAGTGSPWPPPSRARSPSPCSATSGCATTSPSSPARTFDAPDAEDGHAGHALAALGDDPRRDGRRPLVRHGRRGRARAAGDRRGLGHRQPRTSWRGRRADRSSTAPTSCPARWPTCSARRIAAHARLGQSAYTISIWIHVSAAVVGFGATFAGAVAFPLALRLHPRHLPFVHHL